MGKRPLWITLLLWFLLIGDAFLLVSCDGAGWIAAAFVFLVQLFVIMQELRGRSLISTNQKSNAIGMLILLLIEGFIFALMLPTLV
jgi:hypothetical protein